MYRTVFALLPLLVFTLRVSRDQSCPWSCNCYQANEVHCTFRSLITVPAGLPAHTRRINLGFNSIRILHDKSLAGLKRVELLMLHSNELHHLPDAVFRDLKSLQILKLSYNKLREISSSLTFSGLTSLLRLYLDHNLLQHIHPRALLQLPNLRLLRLQGNRLHQLHPQTLCTLSLLNTYYFSTLRHLDLSNNSLTTLSKESVATAPLLETLVLQANPWSCDCRMNWFLSWSLAHPGLMKCPSGLQCPVCASPTSLQGQSLLDQTAFKCTSPIINSPGKENPLDTDLSEIQSSETFREPLGSVSLGLSDQQGNSIDLSCNITHSTDSQDIASPPDLSWTSSSPLHLALSISLECPIEGRSYEKLWRILAYYSETAAQLEREIMLSKAPALAYRYRQSPETDGYYHTGVRASVKATPQWLLQPSISIQLNRAESNGHKVQLMYSTRVSAHPDLTTTSSTISHQWVMILTNGSASALAAVAGRKVELSCPLLSSGNPSVYWILPDGSKLNSPSSSLNGRLQASASDLLIQKAQLFDAGIYYCVARAGRDVDVLPIRLAVEESSAPYSAELNSPPVTGEVGNAVSLCCRMSGSPEPSINWILPDGNIVWQGLAVSGGLTIHSNGSLSLHKPSLRDVGYYRCIAVNQYGSESQSVQLILDSPHISLLETSFPRGPQSASGKSTKIRASLFHQVEEGSGDEEDQEEKKTSVGKRRHPIALQPHPNRQYSIGKQQRHGHVREGSPRRGGRPVSSTEQRRNHFQNRHRVTTKKLRMDPKSWADILAKIRQKAANANNSHHISGGNPTVESIQEVQVRGTKWQGEGHNINTVRAQETVIETETEGSSVDDAILREDQPQPIQPAHRDSQTTPGTKINAEIESGLKTTEKYMDSMTEAEINTQKENESPQTTTAVTLVAKKESVTYNPKSVTNETVFESNEVDVQGTTLNPTVTRPRNPQRLLPNSVPNVWSRKPWNSRRIIGQRRRIMRPRIRPVTSSPPVSDPVTLTSTIDKFNMLLPMPTASLPTILLTTSGRNKNASNGEALNPLPTHFLDTSSISTSNFTSPSLTPSPAHTDTYTDIMTHYGKISQTQDFTFNSTSAPTQPNNVVSETHVLGIDNKTFTHDIQTYTKPQTTSSEHSVRPPNNEDLQRNALDASPFPLTHFLIASLVPSASSATTSATTIITTPPAAPKRAGYVSSMKNTSVSFTSKDTLPTAITITSVSSTMSPSTSNVIPISKTTRQTLIMSTSSTTTTTSTSSPHISSIGASTTTRNPVTYSSSRTTDPSTSAHVATVSVNDISGTFIPSSTGPRSTETVNPTITISTKAPPSTRESTSGVLSSMTTTTKASSIKSPVTGQVDRQEKLFPNQSRIYHNWKNHGANFIPESHDSRFHQSPAAPGATAVRSRPRIADPHIRKVSFPAASTAKLNCEAQGNPKPSVTWTKVATGAVMSIHSGAQRFEVLPNGTLVIQNVQLQDRGTYICSAISFLGRDRLLTTLDVWTRPPRLQLASYREVTIHQGGDVHLECQADGVPPPLLSWVLPDRSTLSSTGTSSNRISLDTNGTLHISGILPSDRGLYRCVASNSAGAASASVRVHVSSLPPVIQQPREEHLLFSLGMPVYAHCSARGAPPPTLRWRIPGGILVRPSQFLHGNLFVLPNGTLHIRRVGPKDAGSYECTASNAVGTYKRTVKVEIKGEAKLERPEEARNDEVKDIKTSNSSSFIKDRTLVIPSHPTDPFDSRKISPVHPSDRSRNPSISLSPSNSSSNSSPKINKTEKAYPSHFTNIRKTNPPSVFSQSTVPTYNTKVSPSINSSRVSSSFPPDRKALSASQTLPVSPFTKAHIVSTSPSTSTFNYGGILKLYCSVTGNPMPNVIWRTPAKKLVDANYSHDQRLKAYPNGTLLVQAITEKDGGDYLCIARNKVSDDYRLLRVNVATKPAKIEPKQPVSYTVSSGKQLKMDCQASGLPHPAVRWHLPDGTMVNSVSQEEDNGEKPTLFDNGTLLVPAVGVKEGDYTCYAENQAGQDIMKVKILMTTLPVFADDKDYHVIKVVQGAAATVPCQARGDPVPTVTWFSPTRRAIPRSLGSGYYSERISVTSDGTLKLRSAQKIDTGNYTCRARNSVGIRNMVVSLEVVTPTNGLSTQSGKGQGWNINGEHIGNYDIRSDDITDNKEMNKHGSTSETSSKLSSSNSEGDNNGRIKNMLQNTGVNLVFSISNPALRSYIQNRFKSPVNDYTAQLGNSRILVGAKGAQSVTIKAESTQRNRNGSNILGQSNSFVPNQSTNRGNSGERYYGTNNEVIAGSNANTNNNRFMGSLANSGAGTSTIRGRSFSINGNLGNSNSNTRRNSDSISGISDAKLGGVTTVKQQAVKGQTVIFPCPSRGSPPPRLSWLLPGNGMLPAPYYGNRLTVHRNGTLELRDVRMSDSGTLVCIVKSERGETSIRVELEVSEHQENARLLQEGVVEKRSQTGDLLNPAQTLITRPVSPLLHQQSSSSSPEVRHPANSLPSTGQPFEPKVSTRTGPLISTINGETFQLPCSGSQTLGSILWTMPSGKMLSRGESLDSGRYVVQEDGTLVIKQASVFDRGSYTCKFSSLDSSSVFILTVPVIVIAYPPRITTGPSPVTYTSQGVAVELPCLTTATPRATVTWETPDLTMLRVIGQPQIYGNRYLSPRGSLVIQNPTYRDTGFYKCTAKNVIGVDSKTTYLHVI